MVILEYGRSSPASEVLWNGSPGQGAMHFLSANSQWSPDRPVHGVTEYYFQSSNDNNKKNKVAEPFLGSSVIVRVRQCAFNTFFQDRKAGKTICL